MTETSGLESRRYQPDPGSHDGGRGAVQFIEDTFTALMAENHSRSAVPNRRQFREADA